MIQRNYKHLFKSLRKKGASYYEAKALVKAFVNGNVDKFKAFRGKIVKIYHPSTGRYTTDFDWNGFRFKKARKEYLTKKLMDRIIKVD